MIQSVHSQIINKIYSQKKKKVIFPADFKNIGSPDAIRKSFSRLEKNGILKRLARGIYLIPKKDPVLGILYPSTEEIAQRIARRDRIRIMPTAMYALNRLGLSTQVPMNVIYLTDGASRRIKIGKGVITLKKTAPWKLALKGKISRLVILALMELGKRNITGEDLVYIYRALSKEDKNRIKADAKLAPYWIAELLFNYLKEATNG
jgi:hypothetical protein